MEHPHGPTRSASFVIVVGVYTLAIVVAVFVAGAMHAHHPLTAALVADLAATGVIFASSMIVKNSSMYDAYWSVAPPLIGAYFVHAAVPGANGVRQTLVMMGVCVWAIRLTSNWARDWPGLSHEDWRYVDMRESSKAPWPLTSLVAVHVFPTLQVFLGCIALWPALGGSTKGTTFLDGVALAVMLTGATLEYVADEQMRRFRRTKQPGQIMQTGLWGRCRHPNYLGELTFWWGVWLAAFAADVSWWWTIAGPLAMVAMFVGASIPMLDKRSMASRPGYDTIVETLPALFPLGPRRVS